MEVCRKKSLVWQDVKKCPRNHFIPFLCVRYALLMVLFSFC